MLLTFKEFKKSPVKRITTVCVDSDEFRDYTNDATRQLMERGNFWGTVQPMEGCVYSNCITWPRRVGAVLATNICGNPLELANRWYRFMPLDESSYGYARDYSVSGYAGNLILDSNGTSPVFNPIACNTSVYIRFYPSVRADVGKTITVFGIDANGQTIMTKRADGVTLEGMVLTLELDYVQSPIPIRKITRVVKDETQGVVRGYQWDSTNNVLLDLCYYEPSETSPDYITTRISGCRTQSNCCTTKVTALVKLQYVPVQHDDDLVLIENVDALRDMILSITAKEAGDLNKSVAMELSAIRELNKQLQNKMPIEQFVVSYRPFGSACGVRSMM